MKETLGEGFQKVVGKWGPFRTPESWPLPIQPLSKGIRIENCEGTEKHRKRVENWRKKWDCMDFKKCKETVASCVLLPVCKWSLRGSGLNSTWSKNASLVNQNLHCLTFKGTGLVGAKQSLSKLVPKARKNKKPSVFSELSHFNLKFQSYFWTWTTDQNNDRPIYVCMFVRHDFRPGFDSVQFHSWGLIRAKSSKICNDMFLGAENFQIKDLTALPWSFPNRNTKVASKSGNKKAGNEKGRSFFRT